MRRRSGFTIVELLVSMALIIFIMTILAEAFSAGTSAFRQLKAIGDMNEKLRATSATLRKYLAADHFEGKKRLSNPTFWNAPPREGFFRIVEGNGSILEGTDQDGLPSYRSIDHELHFAVKLRGNQRGEFFRATVPFNSPLLNAPAILWTSHFEDSPGNSTYCAPWAEVAFFLRPTGLQTQDPDNPAGGGLPLYALYLRQALAVPDNSLVIPAVAAGTTGYLDVSCKANPQNAGQLYFNNAADLTMPYRRAFLNSDQPGTLLATGYPTLGDVNPALKGNDLILTNVLSFDVRVLLAGTTTFVSLQDPSVTSLYTGGTTYGANQVVFDTWSGGYDENLDYRTWATPGSAASVPLKLNITAIKVTIRIWDSRTAQTRQTSVIVDM